MRHLSASLTVVPTLLLWTFFVTTKVLSVPAQTNPSLPFQAPHSLHDARSKSLFTSLRNAITQSIWRISFAQDLGTKHGRKTSEANPPPTLLARYGGDLVLRFNHTTAEETEALTEAISVLFLDVWEFTATWVDIRLSKDLVRLQDTFRNLGMLIQTADRSRRCSGYFPTLYNMPIRL